MRLVAVFRILVFSTVAAAASLGCFMVISPLFGWHFNVVPTSSMVPAVNPGGIVVSRPTNVSDAKVGQIVLFRDSFSGKLICHRVVDVVEQGGEKCLKTKGDANLAADSGLVTAANFVGTMALYVPKVGRIAYLSRLYECPFVFLGIRVSLSMLVVLGTGLAIVCVELNNIGGWLFEPAQNAYREGLRRRRESVAKRKRALKPG